MSHEKEIYEMCIDKIKKSENLRCEVDKIIPTCGTNSFIQWQIHGWYNFKRVCDTLKFGHYKCVRDWSLPYTKVFFEYAGVHVFALVHSADEVYKEAVLHADEVS